MRVVLGVVRGRHLDPGELFAGGAILVHVAHRAHRVFVEDLRPQGMLVLHIGHRCGEMPLGRAGSALRARPPGEGDQRDAAFAGRDRRRRMGDMGEVGRAPQLRAVEVAHLQPHVIDHGKRPKTGRVAVTEIPVDIGLAQAGIQQRAIGDLGVQLCQRRVIRLARRMLIRSDDIGLAAQAHGATALNRPSRCASSTSKGDGVQPAKPWIRRSSLGRPMLSA